MDLTRLQDLDEAMRRYLAWGSILSDKETFDLSPHQVKQAETQRGSADGAVTARLPEAYRVPLWRGDHVAIKQLAEDFARYLCLPRLRGPAVLLAAIRDGLGLLLWDQESFAYADSFDEAAARYRGLFWGQIVSLSDALSRERHARPDAGGPRRGTHS